MKKREIRLHNGRYLVFYTFGEAPAAPRIETTPACPSPRGGAGEHQGGPERERSEEKR